MSKKQTWLERFLEVEGVPVQYVGDQETKFTESKCLSLPGSPRLRGIDRREMVHVQEMIFDMPRCFLQDVMCTRMHVQTSRPRSESSVLMSMLMSVCQIMFLLGINYFV